MKKGKEIDISKSNLNKCCQRRFKQINGHSKGLKFFVCNHCKHHSYTEDFVTWHRLFNNIKVNSVRNEDE